MKLTHLLIYFISSLSLLACSGKNPTTPNNSDTKPAVTIKDVTVKRQPKTTVSRFYVDLSDVSDQEVSVNYKTVDGSAVADSDYVGQSGTLTFQPGDKELHVDVTVTADSLRQPDQNFYVQLSNAQNCTISVDKGTATIVNDGTYLPTNMSGYESPQSYAGYHLVWSDEFNGNKLNTDDWNYETGGGGWGNQELEYYTSRNENSFVSSGNLIIEARKEDYGGNNYTSARLTTKGKQEFTYGRVDIRAKLPVETGMWPALWMLGDNISTVGWPECGETDIMEVIGKNPSQVVGSFHWKKGDGSEGTFNNTHNLSAGNFSDQFHVFSLMWGQDSMKIAVDNVTYVKASRQDLTNGPYPFDSPFFFIFNVAVGGNWPGNPDNTTTFPEHMFVDYVRVFQKD